MTRSADEASGMSTFRLPLLTGETFVLIAGPAVLYAGVEDPDGNRRRFFPVGELGGDTTAETRLLDLAAWATAAADAEAARNWPPGALS